MRSSTGKERAKRRRQWRRRTLASLALALGSFALAMAVFLSFPGLAQLMEEGELKVRLMAIYSRLTSRQTNTSDLTPIAHTAVKPLGINTTLQDEVEESKVRQSLQMIRDAGFAWVRQQFPWREIEGPSKGRYWDTKFNHSTWDKYDRIVNLAQEYGLNLIVRLDSPPDWARRESSYYTRPPDNLSDFGDFVFTVVSRYRGKVRYYQIWNEPNLAVEWGQRDVSASEFTKLLKIAYIRAKEADPDCVVIAPGLAPTLDPGPHNRLDTLFLQEMYDAGAKDYFDIMSTMAYGLRRGPDDRRLDEKDEMNVSRPILLREVMVRNGDAGKPIWLSELAWNALPKDYPEKPFWGRVSEAQQARYTVRALERIQEEWPWVGVVNLWFFKPATKNDKDQQYYFRMVDPDFTPRPVWEAVKRFATNRPAAMPRGYHQEDHWTIKYRGEWQTIRDQRASLGAYALSRSAGDSLSFSFRGTDLTLVTAQGPQAGYLQVWVDGSGARANQLPADTQGLAFLELQAPQEKWQVKVPIAKGLPAGLHTVEIRNMGAGLAAESSIAIDGFIVDRSANPAGGTILGILGICLLVGLPGFVAQLLQRRGQR